MVAELNWNIVFDKIEGKESSVSLTKLSCVRWHWEDKVLLITNNDALVQFIIFHYT